MKSSIIVVTLVVVFLVGLVLFFSAYIVTEGQQAIVTQFGRFVKAEEEAGLAAGLSHGWRTTERVGGIHHPRS